MKDPLLLPHLLPNVFAISSTLSSTQFASSVLPSLKPLFIIKEPPQNMLTLLDNLTMLQEKTDKFVFKERKLQRLLRSSFAVSHGRQMSFRWCTTLWTLNIPRSVHRSRNRASSRITFSTGSRTSPGLCSVLMRIHRLCRSTECPLSSCCCMSILSMRFGLFHSRARTAGVHENPPAFGQSRDADHVCQYGQDARSI